MSSLQCHLFETCISFLEILGFQVQFGDLARETARGEE